MRKMSVMFISVAMVAFILSCKNVDGNVSDDTKSVFIKAGTKQPPDAPVMIDSDVEEWMAEQLASKSNEKRRVHISEMYPPDFVSGAGLGLSAISDSKGNVKYFLEDKEISAEEYNRTVESARQNKTKRNLSIPGVIIYEDHIGWAVLITAAEIAELSKKYDYLSISFEGDPQNSLPVPENN